MFTKLKTSLLVMCILAMFSGVAVYADSASLPSGFLISDHDGFHVSRDGDYFINAVGLKPGDVIKKTLKIQNLENDKAFQLSMTAEPLKSTGPADLLDEIHMNLKLNGQEIYDGRVRGDEGTDMTKTPLPLGEYAYLNSGTLEITLTVDPALEIAYQKSEADIAWHFFAVKNEKTELPKTGDEARLILMAMIVLMAALSVIYMVMIKRNRKKNHVE